MSLRVPIALLLLGLSASNLSADKVLPPSSWMEETNDGRHVFVMLILEGWTEPERHRRDGELPVGYPASGLYLKGGTSRPLYTVDWYAYGVELSADGRYLVRPGPWADSEEDLAVSFYDRGTLLREYRIKELMPMRLGLVHTASHFFWCEERHFDQTTNELRISTTSWNSYRFDATTGEITSSFRGDYMLVGLYIAVPAAPLALLAWITWRRRKRRAWPFRRPAPSPNGQAAASAG